MRFGLLSTLCHHALKHAVELIIVLGGASTGELVFIAAGVRQCIAVVTRAVGFVIRARNGLAVLFVYTKLPHLTTSVALLQAVIFVNAIIIGHFLLIVQL